MVLPPGARAISVTIEVAPWLRTFLKPGNCVDVLVTLPAEGERPETYTRLPNVPVLQAGALTREERSGQEPSVTLMVTPEQAEQIVHAENMGEIVLTLSDGGWGEQPAVPTGELFVQLGLLDRSVRPRRPSPRKCREFTVLSGSQQKVILVDEVGIPCN